MRPRSGNYRELTLGKSSNHDYVKRVYLDFKSGLQVQFYKYHVMGPTTQVYSMAKIRGPSAFIHRFPDGTQASDHTAASRKR